MPLPDGRETNWEIFRPVLLGCLYFAGVVMAIGASVFALISWLHQIFG